jgi:hypothetical protein
MHIVGSLPVFSFFLDKGYGLKQAAEKRSERRARLQPSRIELA